MASTTNNIETDEYSEDQQHVEPGQGSSNSKKAKTWRMQNFPDSWPGQKQNCKIVYFLLVCYIICYSVNKKTLLLACYHLAIDIRSISNKNHGQPALI
jgi:hypothetical protein